MSSESDSGKVDAADYRTRVIDDIRSLRARDWNRLHQAGAPGARTPFMDYRFLRALADSRSIGADTGWTPRFLLLERGKEAVAAAPLFEKDHSYGEYVFDWAWADAYHRHGLVYYPKGLVAVPFTPVPGSRLLASDAAEAVDTTPAPVALADQADALFATAPVSENELAETTGRALDNPMVAMANSSSNVNNNYVGANSTTGTVNISDTAFQGSSGFAMVNINTGNASSIIGTMSVNVQINYAPMGQ